MRTGGRGGILWDQVGCTAVNKLARRLHKVHLLREDSWKGPLMVKRRRPWVLTSKASRGPRVAYEGPAGGRV